MPVVGLGSHLFVEQIGQGSTIRYRVVIAVFQVLQERGRRLLAYGLIDVISL